MTKRPTIMQRGRAGVSQRTIRSSFFTLIQRQAVCQNTLILSSPLLKWGFNYLARDQRGIRRRACALLSANRALWCIPLSFFSMDVQTPDGSPPKKLRPAALSTSASHRLPGRFGRQKLTISVSKPALTSQCVPVWQYITLQPAQQKGVRKTTHTYCSCGLVQELHTSKAGGARLPKITQAVLHSPLRPSKAARVTGPTEQPQKSNWKCSPTQGATIYQTVIGTVAFYLTTFVLRGLVLFRWFVTDETRDAAGQEKHFYVRSVIAFIQQMVRPGFSDLLCSFGKWPELRKINTLPLVHTTIRSLCI